MAPREQQSSAPIGFHDDDSRQATIDVDIRRELRGKLKPEFVNRVKMIHFNRLSRVSAERILDLELERITPGNKDELLFDELV